jgi:uncharacterized protein YgiM (DUF1202 family)
MTKNKRTLLSSIDFLIILCISAVCFLSTNGMENQENQDTVTPVLAASNTSNLELNDNKKILSYMEYSSSTHYSIPPLPIEKKIVLPAETQNNPGNNKIAIDSFIREALLKKASDMTPYGNALPEKSSTSNSQVKETPTNEAVSITSAANTSSPTKMNNEPELIQKYSNIGISVANTFVNIRKDASTDSSIIGKLYRDSAAKILKTKDGWYYVESGSVQGYVKAEYLKTGIPDNELVDNYGVLSIVVDADGLNVREKPKQDSKKLTVIYQDETYPIVDLQKEWIKVNITDDQLTGYVKREYTDLVVDFKEAISKEEETKQLQKQKTSIKHRSGFRYTQADVKLLACLVMAEAGTQSYEGKLAVANVVLNRVKSSKYPDTIKAVIYQSGQFTVTRNGALSKQLARYKNYNSNSEKSAIKAAKAALEGRNNIGTRLYFHTYKAALKKGYVRKSSSVKLEDHLFW